MTWRLALDDNVSSVPQARHWLLRLCREQAVDDTLWDLLALLSTELVANAVLHGRAPVEVSVRLAGATEVGKNGENGAGVTGVVVACSDGSPQLPAVQDVQVEATGGRGVALIDLLSSDWGAQAQADGKCVWFRLNSPVA